MKLNSSCTIGDKLSPSLLRSQASVTVIKIGPTGKTAASWTEVKPQIFLSFLAISNCNQEGRKAPVVMCVPITTEVISDTPFLDTQSKRVKIPLPPKFILKFSQGEIIL